MVLLTLKRQEKYLFRLSVRKKFVGGYLSKKWIDLDEVFSER